MLADEDPLDRLKSTRVEIDRRLEGLARVNWECGRYLDDDGTVREPFGFADGISQPAFFDFEDNPNALPLGSPSPSWPSCSPAILHRLCRMRVRLPHVVYEDRAECDRFQSHMKQMAKSFGQAAHDPQSWMVGRDADGKPLMPTGAGNNDFALRFRSKVSGLSRRCAYP